MDKNSVNEVRLVGRLGADPELKYTTSGIAVANVSIATSHSKKDGNGYVDETEWTRVVIWGKQAEFAEKYTSKGHLVTVYGRLQTRSWEDRDGVKRYMTEVICEKYTSLAKPQGGGAIAPAPAGQTLGSHPIFNKSDSSGDNPF